MLLNEIESSALILLHTSDPVDVLQRAAGPTTAVRPLLADVSKFGIALRLWKKSRKNIRF
ncbi:hypothetical protein [Aliiruegeria lutimaris]|uniref:hypothetical protein n=1 Tax=Aliiruegeria lutimaris TaxID=571298 RepID=UPI001113EC7C|nr:hypothetical protein [Aliiruegeria lutimaris]